MDCNTSKCPIIEDRNNNIKLGICLFIAFVVMLTILSCLLIGAGIYECNNLEKRIHLETIFEMNGGCFVKYNNMLIPEDKIYTIIGANKNGLY